MSGVLIQPAALSKGFERAFSILLHKRLMHGARARAPVVAVIVGRTSPPGKRMGHAGAIIEMGMGRYESKLKALSEAGVIVGKNVAEAVDFLRSL